MPYAAEQKLLFITVVLGKVSFLLLFFKSQEQVGKFFGDVHYAFFFKSTFFFQVRPSTSEYLASVSAPVAII